MGRFEVARWLLQALGTAIVGTVFEIQRVALESHFASLTYWAMFLALVIISTGAGAVGDFLLANVRLLRRIIMWNDDIEGEWLDFAIEKSNGKLVNLAWVTVTYSQGYFKFNGRAWWLPDLNVTDWEAKQTEFRENKLSYRYMMGPFGDLSRALHGAGRVEFRRPARGRRFDRYVGEFIDEYSDVCLHFGERVHEPFLFRRSKTDAQKLELLGAFVQREHPSIRQSLGEYAGLRELLPSWGLR